jgi:hypothetical protein
VSIGVRDPDCGSLVSTPSLALAQEVEADTNLQTRNAGEVLVGRKLGSLHLAPTGFHVGGQARIHEEPLEAISCWRVQIVYNKSGIHVVPAKVFDRRAAIEDGLYWATTNTEAEADSLRAILKAPATTELAWPLMSHGR